MTPNNRDELIIILEIVIFFRSIPTNSKYLGHESRFRCFFSVNKEEKGSNQVFCNHSSILNFLDVCNEN